MKKAKIIVTTIEAVSQRLVPKDVLYKDLLTFKVGDIVNLEEVKQKLVALGYERSDIAQNKSEFSIRGGIIDVATSEKEGVRIELWGDTVVDIRFFNNENQRSFKKVKTVEIKPLYKFILNEYTKNKWQWLLDMIDGKPATNEALSPCQCPVASAS